MPVTWTSPGNFSTARPGSGSADRPDAIPSVSTIDRGRSPAWLGPKSTTSVRLHEFDKVGPPVTFTSLRLAQWRSHVVTSIQLLVVRCRQFSDGGPTHCAA
jgi:hypothetical protein